MSPGKANDDFLKNLPPIRIMVGESDCMKDQSFKFINRLIKLDKNVRMVMYKELTHGFLNYDVPLAIRQVSKCIEEGSLMLREMLDMAK